MTDSWIRQGDVPRVMVPTAIFPKLTVGVPAARAYAALAKLADHETGRVTTTEDQTAVEAAMSKRQVNEGIRILISTGWITRLKRGQQGRPSVYVLHSEPTCGNPRVDEPSQGVQDAETCVMRESSTRDDPHVGGGQHAEYPSVTSGNPRTSSVVKKEEDPLPRTRSVSSLAAEVGATEEEMSLLVEKVRRDHPHVKVPSAWLRKVYERGDLGPMLAEVRAPLAAVPPPPPARCGQCDAKYDSDPISARVVWLADGTSVRCPRCHPLRQAAS